MLFTYVLFHSFVSEVKAEDLPQVNGESAILIDAKTGTIIYEKNANTPMYPASITKIATGIYAIENGNPDDVVTVSKNARYVEGTRVYLGEGEQVPLRKLEYGLLMHSGNDAAIAIAEHMEGSEAKFAEKLNQYLAETVGVEKTHFTNPHGLHDENHYTTASDMAKIARYAMKNETFRTIVGTLRLPWDGKEWKSELNNHNKLLRDYEGATGIKNGFTDQAMHTLVGSAKRGDTEFIAVTMKTSTSALAYKDVRTLLDYGFAHYETKMVTKHGTIYKDQGSKQEYVVDEDLYVTAPLGASIETNVTQSGQLIVAAGNKQYEFMLTPKFKPAPRIPVDAEANKAPIASAKAPYYALFAAWLLLNATLVLYVVTRRTRRQRRASAKNIYRRMGQP
ncbi:D-alanyl-D-alanine carboxypeptidase family protein [Brevibacillus migulae]|uniref:D-alanyl-D-alanine carboxypeptidase family protein n=1 Tax=Brevibacillus migulae TaxID=1644114 RepID=UPI0038B3261E